MQLDIKNDLKTVEQKVRDCQNNTNTTHKLELIMKIALFSCFLILLSDKYYVQIAINACRYTQ
jgi:hypothetical protein